MKRKTSSSNRKKTLNSEPPRYTVNCFENEIYFYNDLWPALTKFYRKATGKSISFVPKCLGTSKNRLRIALENVKLQGFVTFDKRKPFDDKHFSVALKMYGVFHGLSMALKVQNVDEFNGFVSHLLAIDELDFSDHTFRGRVVKRVSNDFQKMFDPSEEILIEQLKLYERIGPKII